MVKFWGGWKSIPSLGEIILAGKYKE